MPEPIFVTRPDLPPLEDLLPYLQEIWANRILTNNGPFHRRFEEALCDFLTIEHCSLVSNGTLALSLAIEAAGIEGEVITTPYSFVATTHALKLAGLEPVFADIRRADFNLHPAAIEAAITPRTSAILAVHVYGNPCAIDEIDRIAKRNGLKVIYDAAHAFGVRYRGQSLLNRGDFSTLSFHATKMFNTFEGGAVIAGDSGAKHAVDLARNFGIASEVSIPALGTNAKMSEFNAALGLLQLDRFEEVRRRRADIDAAYRRQLAKARGIECLPVPADVEANYSYFPILVAPEYRRGRDGLYERLKAHGIHARRYFYPLISALPTYRDVPSAATANLPVATEVADRVLCLPIYPDLSHDDVERIAALIGGESD